MRVPISVILFAVLNIVFGALGLCGVIINLVVLLIPVEARDPISQAVRANPLAEIYLLCNYGLTFLSSVWLLASGVGLLLRQSWARAGSIVYGWIALVVGSVSIAMNYLLITRPMLAQMDQLQARPEERAGIVIGLIVGSICGGVMALAYPALLIYFLSRDHVRRAFGEDSAGSAEGENLARPDTGNPYQSPGG